MGKRSKPPFTLAAKNVPTDVFDALAHEVAEKWFLTERSDKVSVIRDGFENLHKVVHSFLNQVSKIETTTDLRIADNGTPPRIFYEDIARLLARKDLPQGSEERRLIEELDSIETQKLEASSQLINALKQSFADLPAAYFSTNGIEITSDRLAFKVAGSMIRRTIDFCKDEYRAEINFCKNPEGRLGSIRPPEAV